jgi:hypothetical protein
VALDPQIPLEVRIPQIDSPLDAAQKVMGLRSLQAQQVTQQQQQEIQRQQIQENTLTLAGMQRTDAGRKATEAILSDPSNYDPDTGDPKDEQIKNKFYAAGFPELGDAHLKGATQNAENLQKFRDMKRAETTQGLDTVAGLASTASSADEFQANLGIAVTHGLIPKDVAKDYLAQADAAVANQHDPNYQGPALPGSWQDLRKRAMQLSPAAQAAARKQSEEIHAPFKTTPGEKVSVLGDDGKPITIAENDNPGQSEFSQFQAIYAKQFGQTKFSDLTPQQQQGAIPAYTKMRQDPALAGIRADGERMRREALDAVETQRQETNDFRQFTEEQAQQTRVWTTQHRDWEQRDARAVNGIDPISGRSIGPEPPAPSGTFAAWQAAHPHPVKGATPAPAAAAPTDYGYGTRYNMGQPGGAPKGLGYLGPLQRPDGGVMSEYSIGVDINGRETEIPSIVPTLSKSQVTQILNSKDGDPLPAGVREKAEAYAKQRIAAGKDPFAGPGEQQNLFPDLPRQTKSPNGTPFSFTKKAAPKDGTTGTINGKAVVWKTIPGQGAGWVPVGEK